MTDPHPLTPQPESTPTPTPTPSPTSTRTARGRFQPGRSGNPAGKKPGTLNRATVLKQALEDGDFDTAVQTIRTQLNKGNFAAARLLIDRLDPKPRNRPIALEVPDDLPMPERFTFVSRAMFRGEISPDEAKVMVAVLEAEDAAYQRVADREARNAMHRLTMEIYRPELERRLEETWRQCYAPRAGADAGAESETDLHPTCNLEEDADVDAAPDSTPDPVMSGLDPGIVTEPSSAQAPVAMAGSSPAMTDGGDAAHDVLHSACMSHPGYDPATVLPTPRRRAVNRLRAQAAAEAARRAAVTG